MSLTIRSLFLLLSVTVLAACSSVKPNPTFINANQPTKPQSSLSKAHVYIIHGYKASPQDHWFPWLKQTLQAQGATVTVLALPDSQHPQVAAWDHYLKDHIIKPDQHTYFVAHSLGGITLLRYLSALPEKTQIGGITIASGFATLPTVSLLNTEDLLALQPFVNDGYNVEKIKRMTTQRMVIAAKDDPIVPFALTENLAQQLDAQFVPIEKGGHLLASDSFTQFDIVYEVLLQQIAVQR
jgi:predicted alpha/beta hydrolase family esterase